MPVVLAPIDGSARALAAVPWAAKLAGDGGTVVLLRVRPPKPDYAEALLELAGTGEEGAQQIEAAWDDIGTADLEEAAKAVHAPAVAVERVAVAGEPDEEIVATAERRGVDMI